MAAVASGLWIFIVVAFVVTALADEGVAIGAAILVVLAIPLSMTASVLLLVSLVSVGAPPSRRPATRWRRWSAALLAVLSLVLLPLAFQLGDDAGDSLSGGAWSALFLSGISAFITLSALFAIPASRRESRPAATVDVP